MEKTYTVKMTFKYSHGAGMSKSLARAGYEHNATFWRECDNKPVEIIICGVASDKVFPLKWWMEKALYAVIIEERG